MDDITRQSTEGFPEIDLPEGHRNRFIARLDSSLHRNRKILNFQIYSVAASVAVVIALSIFLFFKVTHFRQQPSLLAGVSPELEEAELYYQSRIQERLNVLEANELVDEHIINDLEELDVSLKHVNRDMKRNPGDERIIHAVIQIYQLKLDMINDLLIQLK